MTIKEAKSQINTYKDAEPLKQWLNENRKNVSGCALAYASYKIKRLDPQYSYKKTEDLDSIALFQNTTY